MSDRARRKTVSRSTANPGQRGGTSGFRILEHPSDLGIEACGTTLAKAFEQCARGLVSIFVDPSTVTIREKRSVSLTATDPDQLLVKWLEEILYLYDGERFVAKSPLIRSLSDTSLDALLRGERSDPLKHRSRLDVKAITYHQLHIRKGRGRFIVRAFVDI
jgi:SHS2 domain-containing protein